jgi:hypothetical protein
MVTAETGTAAWRTAIYQIERHIMVRTWRRKRRLDPLEGL